MKNDKITSAMQQVIKNKSINKIALLLVCFMQLLAISLNASTPMLLRLKAIGNFMQNETVVYFDSAGSFIYSPLYDAPSLGTSPGYLNIVTRFDSIDYQIKCLPLLTQNMSIPIKVRTGISGTYQIYGNDIKNLPAGACIILHDKLTNADHDLRLGSYTCFIADTESAARFILNISISMLTVNGSFINPTCTFSGNGLIIASPVVGGCAGSWNYYWKDSLNNIIKTSLLKNSPDTLSGINAGAYRVDITSNGMCTCTNGTCTCTNGMCTNGTLTFYLHGTQSPVALFTPSADTSNLTQGVVFTNNSTNANTYWWDFGDGMGANDTNTTYYYASQGTYTVILIAVSSVCADSSIYAREIVITNQTTGTKQTGAINSAMFISRDVTGYYVKFNYSTRQDVVISVSDLLGQKLTDDMEVKNTVNEKIYVNTSNYENRVLIISVVSTAGEKVYKKIINY